MMPSQPLKNKCSITPQDRDFFRILFLSVKEIMVQKIHAAFSIEVNMSFCALNVIAVFMKEKAKIVRVYLKRKNLVGKTQLNDT